MNIYAGLDEVGTGGLAGPVISVALKLKIGWREWPIPEVRDSKKTRPGQRARIVPQIVDLVHDRGGEIGVGVVEAAELNEKGHAWAVKESFRRAARQMAVGGYPRVLIVDGSHGVDGYGQCQQCEPKADDRYFLVAAASILAKQYRDDQMDILHQKYPEYGWKKNRGYGTPEHIQALRTLGLSPEHRGAACTTALRKAGAL